MYYCITLESVCATTYYGVVESDAPLKPSQQDLGVCLLLPPSFWNCVRTQPLALNPLWHCLSWRLPCPRSQPPPSWQPTPNACSVWEYKASPPCRNSAEEVSVPTSTFFPFLGPDLKSTPMDWAPSQKAASQTVLLGSICIGRGGGSRF